VAGSNNVTLDGIAITNTEESIQISRSTNVTVAHCKIYHTGNESISVHDKSSFVQVLDNVIYDRGLYQHQYSEGIYVGTGAYPNAWNVPFPDTTNNVTIRGNDISNASHDSSEGINIKGETHDVTVENNTIHDMRVDTGGGISIDAPSKDPATGKVYQPPSNANYVIRGNLVHHITTSSQYSDGNGITNKAGGATIYNNVSRDNEHYGVVVNDVAGIKQTTHVLNNTLARNAGSSDAGGVYVLGSSVVDIRDNIGGTRSGNLAYASGLFVNASGNDFHLVKGSAAIDRAANDGVTTDYDGVARPQGAGYDFGAFEYH
jgi:hypothetical protein